MTLPIQLGSIYSIEDIIGSGASSTVHLCRNRTSKEEVSVKIINKSKQYLPTHIQNKRDILITVNRRTTENMSVLHIKFDSLTEVEILRNLRHRNIIKFIDHVDTLDKRFIVTEYVKGETLHHAMCRMQFSERDAAFVINNLMQALSYLHNLKIVHRDISTNNIFITLSGNTISTIKLGDFGAAQKLEDGIQVGYAGTNGFMAPEMEYPYKRRILPVYNFKIDIYSAGIILVCFFIPSTQLIPHIVMGLVARYIPMIPRPVVGQLAHKMIELNPLERLSAENVLNDPWIRMHSTN